MCIYIYIYIYRRYSLQVELINNYTQKKSNKKLKAIGTNLRFASHGSDIGGAEWLRWTRLEEGWRHEALEQIVLGYFEVAGLLSGCCRVDRQGLGGVRIVELAVGRIEVGGGSRRRVAWFLFGCELEIMFVSRIEQRYVIAISNRKKNFYNNYYYY